MASVYTKDRTQHRPKDVDWKVACVGTINARWNCSDKKRVAVGRVLNGSQFGQSNKAINMQHNKT